jgi:protocatechuate 3,4-dioxygenase beta subunit
MKLITTLYILISLFSFSACSQIKKTKPDPKHHIGGPCEDCEAVFESPVPFDKLNWIDTLPDFNEPGPKLMISGKIYQADGITPAAGVVLYVYHTDQNGIYGKKGNETGLAKRHGYIRGWIKTNALGQYRFYTLVPASYPNSSNPKHIHPTIKEPDKNEYWIDDFVFNDDPLLPEKYKTRSKPVGGQGVLKTYMENGMLRATRDIILGLNVAGYPKTP